MELSPNSFKGSNSYRRPNNIGEPMNDSITDTNLRRKAHVEGTALLNSWLEENQSQIKTQILSSFDDDGVPQPGVLTATAFNDLYKWTMLPVIRKLEEVKGGITATFGVDLRDKAMRIALDGSKELEDIIFSALQSLTKRPFDRKLFKDVLALKNLDTAVSDETIDSICGPADFPRMLVDGGVFRGPHKKRSESEADKVTIAFYKSLDAVYNEDNTSGAGVWFIEATGPWHKVTWLETSMMQCVYEAKLRYDLAERGISYNEWLYMALLRCAKSIAYTHMVQKIPREGKAAILPALFTGRRTGGLSFIILQNMLFASYFPAGSALGTASCDAWYFLKNKGLPCLNPVGTNAHELRMGASVLFSDLDMNAENLPLSQIIVDHLYCKLVRSKQAPNTPLPMLPDTLGTRTYLKAAKYVTRDGAPFLNSIGMARQDSGNLKDFLANISEFGFGGKTMASEIDTTKTLLEAAELGYDFFGAGGFFGDSEKVWGDPEMPSNSMAAKIVRASYLALEEKDAPQKDSPYVRYDAATGIVTGYPVKIGDPEDRSVLKIKKGKLSVNKTLPSGNIQAIKERAELVRSSAGSEGGYEPAETITIEELMAEAGIPAIAGGGRRRNNRNRSNRSTRGKKHLKRRNTRKYRF
jgi:nicotinic acid phosphoribosyltransferase